MNDYPADPPRETIRDEHRVYPGDGIAPLTKLFKNFFKYQRGTSSILRALQSCLVGSRRS